jgi:chromosome segregation ATPase
VLLIVMISRSVRAVNELITRDDLDQALDRTVTTLRGEINQSTTMLRGEIAELRGEVTELRGEVTELRGEMGELRTELRGEMGELRTELRGEMGELRGEMGELRTELRGEMTELRGEMVAMEVRLCVQLKQTGSEIAKEVANIMAEQLRVQVSVVDEKYQDLPRQYAELRGELDAHVTDVHMHRRRPAVPAKRARRS